MDTLGSMMRQIEGIETENVENGENVENVKRTIADKLRLLENCANNLSSGSPLRQTSKQVSQRT